MDETTLAQQLEAHLNDNSLVLQVAFAAPYIQVVINRTQLPPDYSTLSERIAKFLGQMGIPEMQYVAVYGRVYGQEEIEYETSLAIVAPAPTAPTPVSSSENPFLTAVTDTPAPSEPEPFNLAKYCFTRNRALLTADLPSPKIALAELLRDFDHFLDSEKQLILEQFSTFLRNPDGVNTANWSEEMRAWLGKVRNFGDEETRNMAIWLSRYCAHPETTLETVRGVIKAAKEAAKERARQEREARLAERQGRTTSGGRSQPSTSTNRQQRGSIPPRRPRSLAAKVFAILGLIVATMVSTWFFRGFTLALDVFGTILFVISFLGGWFGGLTKANEGLIIGRVSTTALFTYLILAIVLLPIAIIIYFILAFFFGFLVIPYVAALAGGIVGALGRWFLEGFGEEDEAEGVKYGRFYGLGKGLLVLTLIAHFAGILWGGLPGLGGIELFSMKKEIKGFTLATCEQLIERVENERFTIQNAIDLIGDNATSIESEIRAGRPGYVWNYDNARIILLSDDISKEAVVDVVAVCMACEKTETALVKGISCQGRLGDSDFDKYFDK